MLGSFLHPTIFGALCLSAFYLLALFITISRGQNWVFFIIVGLIAAWFWSVAATALILAFSFVILNPATSALYFLGFVILGVFVALLKWRAFVVSELDSTFSGETGDALKLHLKNIETFVPSAHDNKRQISEWIAFWPFYTCDYILLLIFRDFFKKIAEWTEGLFDYITNRVKQNTIESYKKKAFNDSL